MLMAGSRMHKLYGLFCILLGALMTGSGYRILRPYRRPSSASGFAGPILGQSVVIVAIGSLLVICGLVMAVVFSMIFFLA